MNDLLSKIRLTLLSTLLLCLFSPINIGYAQTETTTTSSATTNPTEDHPEAFPDVRTENPYYVGVKYLKDHQLVNGYPDGLFRPTQNVNRAEALKMLTTGIRYQIFNNVERPIVLAQSTADNDSTSQCNFTDSDNTAWYFQFICEAFKNKVISGYPDGTFKPEQTINKVEALKMAVLQSGLNSNLDFNENFDDISPNDWFWDYARLANQKSFIVEDRQGNLNPSETLNRGDFSMLIYRLIKSIQNGSEFGRATFYGGKFVGRNTANGETFDTNVLTAAHKTLPFDTMVKVTNLANGKSVIVRINDRGPYVNGTIIDLSTFAFSQIAKTSTGVIHSEVEILKN